MLYMEFRNEKWVSLFTEQLTRINLCNIQDTADALTVVAGGTAAFGMLALISLYLMPFTWLNGQ